MANPQRPEDGHAASPNAGRNAAVALSYDEADGAPRVVAKGYGQLADTIVRTAEENGLYVHESRELVGLLMQVDLDAHIPPQLRCGGRIAGLAVSPGIARDSGRRRAARSIYLRNLHRVGRQRSGISAHPAGRHAFRAVRAHPPRQPHPGARRRRSRDRRAHPGGGQARASSSGVRATTPARTSNNPTAWACSAAPPSTFTPRPMGACRSASGCSGPT